MQMVWQDLRYGARVLRRTPGVTAAIVLTLALGIGGTAAIFSMLRALVLSPLPYQDAERVAFVLGWNTKRDGLRFNVGLADYLELRRSDADIGELAAYRFWNANLTGTEAVPERAQGYHVTPNTFGLLGQRPFLGRTFRPEDGVPGAEPVVVLSHGLWQRRLGADPAVIGRTLRIDGRPHLLVGVMPDGFDFPYFNFKGDLWAPLQLDEDAALAERDRRSVVVVSRLRADLPLAQAQARVDAVFERLQRTWPETNSDLGARVQPMQSMLADQVTPVVAALFVAAGLVLLIACANVTNLLLARGYARARELAVRGALGANGWRLVSQVLTENLMLGLLGGAAGVGVAYVTFEGLRSMTPDFVLRVMPNVQNVGLDWTIVGFTLLVGLATGVVVSLLPAMRVGSAAFLDSLRAGARAGDGAREGRLRSALVVLEISTALLLLVLTGLLVRGVSQLLATPPGFTAEGVLSMRVALTELDYPTPARWRSFYESVAERFGAIPGVSSVGLVNVLPFSTSDTGTRFEIEGRPAPAPGDLPAAGYRVITPGYVETLRIPLVAGRNLTDADRAGTEPVALVNQSLARAYFPDQDPLGRRLRLGGPESEDSYRIVVGVVGDVKHFSLTIEPRPEIYVPFAQAPEPSMTLVVGSPRDPADLAAAARAAVVEIDRHQPLFDVATLADLVANSAMPQRVAMRVMAAFGIVALALAAMGIYGLVSYIVGLMTREIGVRVVVGAEPRDVVRLVLVRGAKLVALGTVLGFLAATAASRLLGSVLEGVARLDVPTYALAGATMTLVALAACAAPVRRALRVDPVLTLRAE